jgi:hypothetical protein
MRLILLLACMVGIGCVEIGNFSLDDNATAIWNSSSNESNVQGGFSASETETETIPSNTTASAQDQSTTGNPTLTTATPDTIGNSSGNEPNMQGGFSASETETETIPSNTTASAQDQLTTENPTLTTATPDHEIKPLTTSIPLSITALSVDQTSTGTPTVLVSPTVLDQITTEVPSISLPYATQQIWDHSTSANDAFQSADDVQIKLTSQSSQIKKITTKSDVQYVTEEQHPTSVSTTHHKLHEKDGEQHASSQNWLFILCGFVVCMCVFTF